MKSNTIITDETTLTRIDTMLMKQRKRRTRSYKLLLFLSLGGIVATGILSFSTVIRKDDYEWNLEVTTTTSHESLESTSISSAQIDDENTGSNHIYTSAAHKSSTVNVEKEKQLLTINENDHGGSQEEAQASITRETQNDEIQSSTQHYETIIETVTSETCIKEEKNDDWMKICRGAKIVDTALSLLQKDQDPIIIQVGAHIGFERNDPISKGIQRLITSSTDHIESVSRDRFHWFFVEASPPNYAKLEESIEKNKDVCKMYGIHAGIISELQKDQDMTFYSLSDTIDPETGYDSRSKNKFPPYITQVSSFSKENILLTIRVFERRSLNIEDYIVETKVPLKTISDLMDEVNVSTGREDTSGPLILLIDAERNDCDIILGISPRTKALPHYILYERHCSDEKEHRAIEHLKFLGYDVLTENIKAHQAYNHIAVRKDLRT